MDIDSGDLKSWELDLINGYLKLGGELISEEHYQARRAICTGGLTGKPCEKYGQVKLPFGTVAMGCRDCGCPVTTKPRVKKYFNPLRLRVVRVECPLSKWADIDNDYFS